VKKNFQEENPLKLKSLVVITLFVLGCSAAFAQGSATLGFENYGGTFLYCNYEIITWGGPNNFYLQGTDNLETACFAAQNATVEGVKVPVPLADGAPVHGGTVYAYADNLIDAFSATYTGEQWFVLTKIKPSTLLHNYGWAGYLGVSGYEFLDNYGYLSASIPGNGPTKPVSSNHTAASAQNSPVKAKTIR
jgi:hypothetical protein